MNRLVRAILTAAPVVLALCLAALALGAKPPPDRTPPAVTLTAPADGSAGADSTPTYAGAAGTAKGDSSKVTVRVYAGASATGTPVQTLTATRSGSSWSIAGTTALAAGSYTAQASQSDRADNTGVSSANSFEVATGGVEGPVIAAAGDIACDPADGNYNGGSGTASACRQLDTSNLLTGGRLARVLTLGDNQYENGALSKFLASYDPSWGRVKDITSPALGNHEYGTAGAAGHFDYFNGSGVQAGPAGERGKGYYSFDVGSWHLIAINSNCAAVGGCHAGSTQEQWLKADLEAHAAACTLAYWHHPRFSSGPHGNSAELAPIWQTLYDHGADVVLAGHDHDYERFGPQDPAGNADAARGLREFVVGTGGKTHYVTGTPKPNSEVRNSDSFGVLELTLGASSYGWRFVPAVGTFTDEGRDDCH